MILNGPRLFFNPGRYWKPIVTEKPRNGIWLISCSAEAATLAAVAVVGGHVASAFLGIETHDVAIQRAAVGLLCTFAGALVMAPAFVLVLMLVSSHARSPLSASRAIPAAMGFLWPAWFAGFVLGIPPMLGLGPEPGEILWVLAGLWATIRILRTDAPESLSIRRRWRFTFQWQTALGFFLLFISVPVIPALIARSFLEIGSPMVFGSPVDIPWPVPPEANW